jgi:hypothetical protein
MKHLTTKPRSSRSLTKTLLFKRVLRVLRDFVVVFDLRDSKRLKTTAEGLALPTSATRFRDPGRGRAFRPSRVGTV